ncbi:agmatine/peptidylarginine deiminase [Salinisphaera sp. LB1]|uniref:agmatine deiminase family protein n=1 Tax=Salinisphaera sp. LB1 TaxID=2183911 RepID=UPI000D705052|nr:agmatine deiminase family protein [Salinisphaera sp. LB1]AWN16982.1 Agmatine deiminase [Salinisphaera sp. LB1]
MTARHLPAEWAPQSATLLVWPRANGDWGDGVTAARDTVAAMASALLRFQPVVLVAPDDDCATDIRARSRHEDAPLAGIRIATCPADDIWARDTGPVTVYEAGRRRFVDFRFDGWGGKFEAARDDALTAALYADGALGPGDPEHNTAVLEGGSIESNGRGTILTTERCLLTSGRNAGFTRADAERLLARTLGARTIHWLAHGNLIGDDTDGHIDTLARFVAPDTIVHQGCADPADAHHAGLAAMAGELAALRDADGAAYKLIELPLPAPQYDPGDGHRLPAGYANFLIANGCVLVPAFDDPADAEAAAIIGHCFPDREIIPIDSRALIRQHGGLHCAAMQIPAEPDHA